MQASALWREFLSTVRTEKVFPNQWPDQPSAWASVCPGFCFLSLSVCPALFCLPRFPQESTRTEALLQQGILGESGEIGSIRTHESLPTSRRQELCWKPILRRPAKISFGSWADLPELVQRKPFLPWLLLACSLPSSTASFPENPIWMMRIYTYIWRVYLDVIYS